jgi:hypothetical protein
VQLYKNNSIIRLLTFITALQILNLSIDAPGTQMANYSARHDNFNYIDSYIEFVAEIILKYDNAVPESNHRQQKELLQHKQFVVICDTAEPVIVPLFYPDAGKIHFAYSDKYFYQFIKEINPPPKYNQNLQNYRIIELSESFKNRVLKIF